MNSKYKHCPYCGEEILAVAKKCRYCGEWLDTNDVPGNPQQTESEEPEDYSEEEMDEKPSFIRRTWKVLLPVLVIPAMHILISMFLIIRMQIYRNIMYIYRNSAFS